MVLRKAGFLEPIRLEVYEQLSRWDCFLAEDGKTTSSLFLQLQWVAAPPPSPSRVSFPWFLQHLRK